MPSFIPKQRSTLDKIIAAVSRGYQTLVVRTNLMLGTGARLVEIVPVRSQ
jgi:hypothetical protein